MADPDGLIIENDPVLYIFDTKIIKVLGKRLEQDGNVSFVDFMNCIISKIGALRDETNQKYAAKIPIIHFKDEDKLAQNAFLLAVKGNCLDVFTIDVSHAAYEEIENQMLLGFRRNIPEIIKEFQ